jgi:Rha family phage regulatory protein
MNKDEKNITSFRIAEFLQKKHTDLVRDIENLDCSEEFTELNFELCEKIVMEGNLKRKVKYYKISKNGVIFLMMGYHGKRASILIEKIITEFEETRKANDNNSVIHL